MCRCKKRKKHVLYSFVHNVEHVEGMLRCSFNKATMVADMTEEANSRHNTMVGNTGMITGEGPGLRMGSCILSNI
jgi:hypothetical protein